MVIGHTVIVPMATVPVVIARTTAARRVSAPMATVRRVVIVPRAIVPMVIARKATVPTATGRVRSTTIPAAMAGGIMPTVLTAIILRAIVRTATVPTATARGAITRMVTGPMATVRKAIAPTATVRRARVPSGRTGVSVAEAVVAAEAVPPR